jgi:hypothetical protein
VIGFDELLNHNPVLIGFGEGRLGLVIPVTKTPNIALAVYVVA